MSALKSYLWWAMPPTAFLSLVSLLSYLVFRIVYLATAEQVQRKHSEDATFNRLRTLALPWIFFVLELIILLPNAVPYFIRIFAIKPEVREKRYLVGDDVPNIDVLITTCNEDLAVVMDTVRAACVLDYPADRYRIFVCDDGASTGLRNAIESYAVHFPQLHYTARVKGAVADYKAGNLNHGLKYSASVDPLSFSWLPRLISPKSDETLSSATSSPALDEKRIIHKSSTASDLTLAEDDESRERPRQRSIASYSMRSSTVDLGMGCASYAYMENAPWGQYVAALDADMIPMPHWLRSLVPHIEDNADCAMVCPPQTFYDIPVNDPLTQTMSHFAGMNESINDALGNANCLGSGYIMRRTALKAIGGFPTESLSEDVCCSATLLGAGWKTAFIPEAVQYGSVSDSYLGHVKQRTRWWVGHIQTAKLFKLRMGVRAEHMNFKQRLAGIAFDLRQLVQIPIALSYLIIPFVLLSGSPLVFWATGAQLKVLIRLVCIWSATHWIHNGVMGGLAATGNEFTSYDVRMASYDAEMEQWLSPYYFIAFMRSFVLPKALGGETKGFKASGSIPSDLQERSVGSRAPLLRRLRVILFSQYAWIHAIFVLACLIGFALNLARAFSPADIPNLWDTATLTTMHDRLVFFVTRLGWPPLFWMQFIASALTPILYAIWPPTQPDREELLDRDEKTGVAYPKIEARNSRRTPAGAWRYGRATIAMLYTFALFVANEIITI
ncbi:hypothetical protein Q7P35_005445 [Cladosporium inversicolor]